MAKLENHHRHTKMATNSGGVGSSASISYRMTNSNRIVVDNDSVYADVDRTPMDTRRLRCSMCGQVPRKPSLLMDDGAGGFRCSHTRACQERGAQPW